MEVREFTSDGYYQPAIIRSGEAGNPAPSTGSLKKKLMTPADMERLAANPANPAPASSTQPEPNTKAVSVDALFKMASESNKSTPVSLPREREGH